MKRISLFLASLLVAGCASTSPKPEVKNEVQTKQYEPAAASALAFESPIFAGYELPGLDRAAREPGVFMGYEETTVETYTSGIVDHQSNDPWLSYYDRWSYSEKAGTRYR